MFAPGSRASRWAVAFAAAVPLLLAMAGVAQAKASVEVVVAFDAANGVWRFDRFTGDATRPPGTAAIGIPNGLTFDEQANLYATDSARGAISRIPRG